MLLLIPLIAQAGWFGQPDGDADGVSDLYDTCRDLAETDNRYADDDGCPDYLTRLRLEATWQRQPIEADLYVAMSAGLDLLGEEPLRFDAIPQSELTVAASRECLSAEADVTVQHTGVLALELVPTWDRVLSVRVIDADGHPVPEASATTLVSSTPGCAPTHTELPAGGGPWVAGPGTHLVRFDAPGVGSVEQILHIAEDAPLTSTLTVRLPDLTLEDLMTARVHFPTDRTTLGDEDRAVLDQLADELRDLDGPPRDVWVEGHTDRRASDAYNHGLSLERAREVQSYLAQQGVEPEQVRLLPRGERDPLTDGTTPREREANRRATVVVEP